MRYWVYLGEEPIAGPFPNYDEADRERQHLLKGLIIGGHPSIYRIRTDQYSANHPIGSTEDPRPIQEEL